MRRILSILTVFLLVLSFGDSYDRAYATTPSKWLEQDAKVSEEVYDLLKEKAGFASYIYTGRKVSMEPENLSNFIIEETYDDYFIGQFSRGSNVNKILVTHDGLVTSYTPKEYAHTMFRRNRHFVEVQAAVKLFVGPTIEDTNYINFASLKSNKATSVFTPYERDLTVPSTAVINHIGYSHDDLDQNFFYPDRYGTILAASLQPGTTHELRNNGRYIDNILVYNEVASAMNIFYTSDTPITIQDTEDYRTLELTNRFVVVDQEQPPVNQLERLKINLMKNEMSIGETQFITLSGAYTDGKVEKIDFADAVWRSTNPKVADFKNGQLRAISSGTTTLIANYDGQVDTVNLRVLDGDFIEFPRKLNVKANKKWKVKFNADINLSTVLSDSVYITDDRGNEVSIYHSPIDSETIQIIPDQNYEAGKTYTIWIKDVESEKGQILQKTTKMDFTIRK